MNIRDVLKEAEMPKAEMPEAAMPPIEVVPEAEMPPAEAVAAPSRKKSRGKPTVGVLAPEASIPPIVLEEEPLAAPSAQPLAAPSAQPLAQPLAQPFAQPLTQGGASMVATKRTLRISGQQKNIST